MVLASATGFGSLAILAKAAYAEPLGPEQALAFRFLLAAVGMVVLALLLRQNPLRIERKRLMVLLAMGPWSPRALSVIVFASVWLVVVAFPDGESALYQPVYLAVCAAGALLAAVSLRRPDPLGLRRPPAQRAA